MGAARMSTIPCGANPHHRSVGIVPVDVRAMGVDFLASGTLKYLMGAAGIAFLYLIPLNSSFSRRQP